jgi:hypothetical protein
MRKIILFVILPKTLQTIKTENIYELFSSQRHTTGSHANNELAQYDKRETRLGMSYMRQGEGGGTDNNYTGAKLYTCTTILNPSRGREHVDKHNYYNLLVGFPCPIGRH